MLENVNVQRVYDLALGCVGGSVATVYVARKYGAAAFSLSLLASNISLGAFVGYLVGGVVPAEWNMHDVIVSFSGVTAYSIIEIGETKFAKYIYERLFNFRDIQNPEAVLTSDPVHTEPAPQPPIIIRNEPEIIRNEPIIIVDRRRIDLPVVGGDRRTQEPEYID
jgi:hypothetical protein